MNIRPLETALFHTDRRTDGHDEANSRFSKLYDASNKGGKKTSNTYLGVKSMHYSNRKFYQIFLINNAIIINYKY
jgi:hypothetical protein